MLTVMSQCAVARIQRPKYQRVAQDVTGTKLVSEWWVLAGSWGQVWEILCICRGTLHPKNCIHCIHFMSLIFFYCFMYSFCNILIHCFFTIFHSNPKGKKHPMASCATLLCSVITLRYWSFQVLSSPSALPCFLIPRWNESWPLTLSMSSCKERRWGLGGRLECRRKITSVSELLFSVGVWRSVFGRRSLINVFLRRPSVQC